MSHALSFGEMVGPYDGMPAVNTPGTYAAFVQAASNLRTNAGKESAVAYAYINSLIQCIVDMRPLMAAEEGETAANHFYSLCRTTIETDGASMEEDFARTIIAHQKSLPSNLSKHAQIAICFLELSATYLPIAATEYAEILRQQRNAAISPQHMEQMAILIYEAAGASALGDFHNAFVSLFLTPSPMALFRLGFSQALSDILSDDRSGGIAFMARMNAM